MLLMLLKSFKGAVGKWFEKFQSHRSNLKVKDSASEHCVAKFPHSPILHYV